MRIESSRVIELIKEKDNVLILTHKSPDGDTIGSGVALCRLLLAMGKKARVENSEVIPDRYSYLFENLEMPEFEPEYIVAVDVADTTLLGDKLSLYADKVDLCIDHHGSNREYAKELHLCADDGAASLTVYRIFKEMGAKITECIYDILKKMHIKITPLIATALYTGISTDTGCFRYANASSECYTAAADLIALGARSAFINVLMFETKPLSYFTLLKDTLAGMRMFCDGKVCVMKVTQEMLRSSGATLEHCDAISAMSRQIEGVMVGITMKEREDGKFKFSLRTYDPIDASKLCGAFGGGGHMRAAGCTPDMAGEEALQKLVDMIADELGLPKESVGV